jgi:hypothetical protein
MGNFRFYRRIRLFPGVSVNVSKSGPSLTVGMRGAHVTVGSRGVRKTIGIPGTGIYYTSSSGYHSGVHSAHVESAISDEAQNQAHRFAGFVIVALFVGLALWVGFLIGSGSH